MADSRVRNITNNLQTTYNNREFVYDNGSYTSTCELQRFIRKINNRYPFIEISGPAAEVVSRASGLTNVNLHYLVEFRDNRISDDYIAGVNKDPITLTMANISADLQKISQLDITRGGNAENTNWGDFGYYFDVGPDDSQEFVVYQELTVQTKLSNNDPYIGG